ncbi:VOC family protein [candidate division KSB1 bacterium]|nr:VOC family protein [candidate division KSB1 bacterium]
MSITGLHHITLVCSAAARTLDFYTRVLGLRTIKLTVNFDDPASYHLYFGNSTADPGSAITFFEWPQAPQGRPGIGGTHHFALTVASYQSLLKWKRYLNDLGIRTRGPSDHFYFRSLYFRDPDGVRIELATTDPGLLIDEPADQLGTHDFRGALSPVPDLATESWADPVPQITADMLLTRGLHHISAYSSDLKATDHFYRVLLGLHRLKRTADRDGSGLAHWFWGDSSGTPGTLISYFEQDPATVKRAQIGIGQTHHFALGVPDEAAQLVWRRRLIEAGHSVSPVMDRVYFKSIYTHDPDGHIVELATMGPGFAVDEPLESLGQSLKLPPWLESKRNRIESVLRPLTREHAR